MKPQASFIKQSTQQRGARKNKERGPKFKLEPEKPKVGHKGAKEQIIVQSSPHRKEHIREGDLKEQ